jgi:hypothetical protein
MAKLTWTVSQVFIANAQKIINTMVPAVLFLLILMSGSNICSSKFLKIIYFIHFLMLQAPDITSIFMYFINSLYIKVAI